MATIKINSKKLKEYQDLFFYAGQICRRVLNSHTRDNRTHGTVKSATDSFLKVWYSNNNLRALDCTSPIATLMDAIRGSNGEHELYEAVERFFYDVVYDVARVANVKIVYHQVYASEQSHYGVVGNDYRSINYVKKLIDYGYSSEDIINAQVKVDTSTYNY